MHICTQQIHLCHNTKYKNSCLDLSKKKLILLAISTARTREGEFSIFTSYVWKVVLIDDGLLL